VESDEYRYTHASSTWSDSYLWPALSREVQQLRADGKGRIFDLGCGNGYISGMLDGLGFEVVGVDTSESGIAQAAAAHPRCRFEVANAYDDLVKRYGRFPVVVSLEVVEHLYDPHGYATRLFDLVEPGGTAIISTPYHGYIKNVALALTGQMDRHFGALWVGGHIKFFSIATLGKLLADAGFASIRFLRVGRVPPLAKSLMAIAVRPQQNGSSDLT
jgi:2-polyprenyl-6-hydroxyphenyl methylase/3-demethylubiquinone-9 3-methyltransferase